MPADREALLNHNAEARAGLAGIRRVDRNYLPTGARCLGAEDGEKFAPACVTDTLGQMAVLHHSGDLQIFVIDHVKLAHEGERRLVLEVLPLTHHLLVRDAALCRLQATLTRDPVALEREALRRAAYIVGTNLLDAAVWPDEAVIALYREQTVAERGFAFLKDPLFLASSVFVKRPERIMALAFIMTLCLLVYKLAEVRVRQRLAATGLTVPDQVRKPTARPTLRWLFQCFEGVDLHDTLHPDGSRSTEVLRLTKVHRLVLHLLGPAYENCYLTSQETAE